MLNISFSQSASQSFAGTGPETARSAFADKAERRAASAVDAGHLDMGNLRTNSATTPHPTPQSTGAPRRATLEPHQAPSNRVILQPPVSQSTCSISLELQIASKLYLAQHDCIVSGALLCLM